MSDLISRQAAIKAIADMPNCYNGFSDSYDKAYIVSVLEDLPSAQAEIIHCKDCKHYSPMNKETKTGICNLTMHQNFGDDWFCAGAERRADGV